MTRKIAFLSGDEEFQKDLDEYFQAIEYDHFEISREVDDAIRRMKRN